MNKLIISILFLCMQMQPGFISAQTPIAAPSATTPNASLTNSLEGTYWTGQGAGDEEVFIFELKFKPKGKVTYVLAEYGLKDKTFYGTYMQTGNSFEISFTGKTKWKIEGKVNGERIKCNRIFKNSTSKEYILERAL